MKRFLTVLLALSGVVLMSAGANAKEEKLYIAIQDNSTQINNSSVSQAELLKPIEPAVDPTTLQVAIEEANARLQSPGTRKYSISDTEDASLVEPLCIDPCVIPESRPTERTDGVGVQWPVN